MKVFVTVKTGMGESVVKQIDATHYAVTTTELPVRGKANAAIIRLLADHLQVAPSLLAIKRGQTTKRKTIEVIINRSLF